MSMNVIGDMSRYTQYQTATAIPMAAQNEGGMAGMGVGMGAGVAFGQAMAGQWPRNRKPCRPPPRKSIKPSSRS